VHGNGNDWDSMKKEVPIPHFMLTKDGELIFSYRDGGTGNGNELYNNLFMRNKTCLECWMSLKTDKG